jgi:hypothetical protein
MASSLLQGCGTASFNPSVVALLLPHWQVNGYFNAESNAVGIATGGDIEPVAVQYQIFSYNEENSMPAPLDDFKERIDCLIGGTTADEIDDCLTKDMAPPSAPPTSAPTSAQTSDGDEINVEDTVKGGDSGAAVGLSPSLFNLLLCATVVSLTWRS